MEGKKECVKTRETKEREFGDESIHTVLFTAGTALLMVGLKRAIMMLFIEQWRLWVFLILNLVLLAIFFTSMHSNSSSEFQNQESGGDDNVKRKIKQLQCERENEESKSKSNGNVIKVKIERSKLRRDNECKFCSDDDQGEANYYKSKSNDNADDEQKGNGDDDDDDDRDEYESEMEAPRLSKEELNERVEAFIATFRQHLVLDARRGREKVFSRRQRVNESFIKLQKGTKTGVFAG